MTQWAGNEPQPERTLREVLRQALIDVSVLAGVFGVLLACGGR